MSCVAITIGPIGQTIGMTHSPAGLWAASGLFSYIAENICRKVTERFGSDAIINPIHNVDESSGSLFEIQKDGVGKYHDRIFFLTESKPEDIESALQTIFEDVRKNVAAGIIAALGQDSTLDNVKKCSDFLKNYLTFFYCIDTSGAGENYITKLSPYLDALEWTGRYEPTLYANYLMKLFEGTHGGKNAYVRNCFLAPPKDHPFQLLDTRHKDQIRDIDNIANPSGERAVLKYQNYFAVVSADGDNMGTTLKKIVGTDPEKLKTFSAACRGYLVEASKIIGEYQGLIIYAGGDDLLFLAPVQNGNKTIFEVLKEIRVAFEKELKIIISKVTEDNNKDDRKGDPVLPPSLSFGVSIHYKHFPLQEALEDASNLLQEAKRYRKEKNCTAFSLRKTSGQNCELIYGNHSYAEKMLMAFLKKHQEDTVTDTGTTNEALHSILYHLRSGKMKTQQFIQEHETYQCSTYELIIKNAIHAILSDPASADGTLLKEVFNNLFDSDAQQSAAGYLKLIRESLLRTKQDGSVEEGLPYDDVLQMLWMAKFFVEKAGSDPLFTNAGNQEGGNS